MRLPFADRAALGCHAQLDPSRATALGAFARALKTGLIPKFTLSAYCQS